MGCNCPGARRSARLSKAATKKATRLANAGINIKPAKPKRVQPKTVKAKTVKPCNCT